MINKQKISYSTPDNSISSITDFGDDGAESVDESSSRFSSATEGGCIRSPRSIHPTHTPPTKNETHDRSSHPLVKDILQSGLDCFSLQFKL